MTDYFKANFHWAERPFIKLNIIELSKVFKTAWWGIMLLAMPDHLQAQSFFEYQRSGQLTVYAGTGIAKYFGELSNDRQLGDFNAHITLGMSIPVKPKLLVRPEISFYRLSAADSDLPPTDSRRSRNLSFKSNNLELSVLAAYGLLKEGRRGKIAKVKPYLLGGVGITYFNPQAQLDGIWHELQPLLTEGVDYQKFHLVLPLGAGTSYQIDRQTAIAFEISYRFTFTDYLDDVSTKYRDPFSFADPIAAALADRRPEIGLEKAPAGSKRGNPQSNDGYLFLGVKAFYQLPGSGPLRRKR